MITNITFSSQDETTRQPILYKQGDLVYLYGDTGYTGELIRPIERTSPPLSHLSF